MSNARDAAIQNAESSNLSLHNLNKIVNGGRFRLRRYKTKTKTKTKRRTTKCPCKSRGRGKCRCRTRCKCKSYCQCKCRTKRLLKGGESSSVVVPPLPNQSLNSSPELTQANALVAGVVGQTNSYAVYDKI